MSTAARPGVGLVVLRGAATLGATVMAATIVLALASGAPLGTDGSAIAALVLGRVTLVDLGLALVAGWAWIAWRGRGLLRAIVWLVVVAVTGSLGILGHLAFVAWRSSSVAEALVGDRAAALAPGAAGTSGGAH